jgi:hypothetical protein
MSPDFTSFRRKWLNRLPGRECRRTFLALNRSESPPSLRDWPQSHFHPLWQSYALYCQFDPCQCSHGNGVCQLHPAADRLSADDSYLNSND